MLSAEIEYKADVSAPDLLSALLTLGFTRELAPKHTKYKGVQHGRLKRDAASPLSDAELKSLASQFPNHTFWIEWLDSVRVQRMYWDGKLQHEQRGGKATVFPEWRPVKR